MARVYCQLLLTTLLFWSANTGVGLRVLGLFPQPSISHFQFFHPIMRGLAEAGHNVSVLSHFPDENAPIGYTDYPLTPMESLTNSINLTIFENGHFMSHFVEFWYRDYYGRRFCNCTLNSDGLAQVIRIHWHTRYDIILMEQLNTDCLLAVAYLLKVPVIALASSGLQPWHYKRIGAPILPSYIPNYFLEHTDKMNFFQRLSNTFSFIALNLLHHFVSTSATDKLIESRFGPGIPSVSELALNTSAIFVNQHYSLSGVKPYPPTVVELGGIHIAQSKPIDVELQQFLDSATDGVIVISWGSMVRATTMRNETRDAILQAAKRLKQRFLWKWEESSLENKPNNMYISKYLPQRDILCHPNVKVFMTHAGVFSSSEAVYCGVPVIATPLFSDQFLNAAALQARGMGLILHYNDITENSTVEAIQEVLKRKYRKKAELIADSFNNRPQKPLQTAIWWVEHIAKTKGASLMKSAAVQMSYFVLYSMDLLLIIFIMSIFYCFFFLIICCPRRKKSKKITKVKKTN